MFASAAVGAFQRHRIGRGCAYELREKPVRTTIRSLTEKRRRGCSILGVTVKGQK